ncbi:MAG: polysaccharide deacetylase family protein [Carboxylicivirga sp.]|jgi:peptidoglycan/xylan/chitin deacetylase (PgdA/CDA1 family)|nr:polysaccharide deacetylase family protein [Carboxylicivirga sp.]
MAALTTYYKKYLAQSVAPVFSALQINRLLAPIYGGIGHVLMLHRVLPSDGKQRIHNHQSLEITPEHLSEILNYLCKAGYEFISIDRLADRIKKPTKRRFVVITLDDGYSDNLQYALPVFEKFRVPFTIYICNNFPDKKIFLWWYMLEELLLKKEELKIESKNGSWQFDLSTRIKKEKAFNLIRSLKNEGEIDDSVLWQTFKRDAIDSKDYAEDKVLSWTEIKQLATHPLVTIGAHTQSHSALKMLGKELMLKEITESKRRLENATGQEVKHFAYPFGSPKEVSQREIQAVKKLQFETAVTTGLGNIYAHHQHHLACLPRISINALTSISVLKAQLAGVIPMIENKFKRSTFEQFK